MIILSTLSLLYFLSLKHAEGNVVVRIRLIIYKCQSPQFKSPHEKLSICTVNLIRATFKKLWIIIIDILLAASSVKSDAGLDADTIIIGAGIAGLSAAEELIR